MYESYHIFSKEKYNSIFPTNITVFLPMLPLKLLHYLLFGISYQVDIIIVYIVSASTSQSLSKFHSLFNNEKACAEKEGKIDFISSIWDDDRIQRIDENNWKWLGCS